MNRLKNARVAVAGEAQLELTANGKTARYEMLCQIVGELCELIGDY